MFNVGQSGLAPKSFNMSASESLKKLQYLKVARMPRLMIRLSTSQAFDRLEWSFLMTSPVRNVVHDVISISPRNLQSHQP